MELKSGAKLGPYEILSSLGKGGMGEVWRARDPRLNREAAIKVSAQQFTDRFEREAHAIASLNHPNICTLFDIGPNYLVMELIEGPTLAERIAEGPIPVEEALPIARQIADALEAAHEKNIIHRDLKPANIKIRPDGSVKVLDFGLAKANGPETVVSSDSPTMLHTPTQIGVILGTAAYMAPEQARGKTVDKRADIWSFGIVLHEMLTGKRVFEGEDLTETLASVVKSDPDLTPVPAKFRKLLAKCLQKDPKKRLRDIGDWELLLEETSGTTSPAQAASPIPHKVWIGAAVVMTVAFAALAFIHFRETPEARPLTRFSVDLGPDAASAPRITAAISPDGRRLAFVARGADGKEQLATRLLDQANATVLAGTEGAADPFFSPDSQWIGFFADGKMKKISVQGGATVTLCDAPNGRGASWGEDGSIIVTLNFGTGLSRVPDSGGAPQALTKPGDTGDVSHRWPQILPGGQAVLFGGSPTVGDWNDAAIDVLSLKTGQVKVVERGGYFARYVPTSSRSGTLVYIHQGTLFGVPFDPERLEARGTPAPLLEDVAGEPVTGGGQFDFSRNGTFVYLSGKSGRVSTPLEWLDSTGKTEPLLATPSTYYSPRLSPDGKLLAFSGGTRDIEVYDGERDRTTRLTFTSQAINMFPVWAPDGKYIVFRSQSGSSSLQWVRADGAGGAQRLMESKFELRPYSFSPDGKRLAFAQVSPQTGFDIWILPLDVSDPEHPRAGKPELFLSTIAEESEPAFSPDGRWIAYSTSASGPAEVYVQPFPGMPGAAGGKWLIGAGRHPVWSRNGREIFYFNPATSRIMVATYAAKGDSFSADKSRVWSDTQIWEANATIWNFDLAPDGKRAVLSPRAEAGGQKGSVHVTVLENFFDELRRKMPGSK